MCTSLLMMAVDELLVLPQLSPFYGLWLASFELAPPSEQPMISTIVCAPAHDAPPGYYFGVGLAKG
jgi:hypothetical protein